MHRLVLIKEVMLDRGGENKGVPIIGTKVYLPYNTEDVYEGGRSVFVHDPHLVDVLNEVCGLSGPGHEEADLDRDLQMLRVIDRLPSLDGFLMRDALDIAGIATNDQYLELTEEERAAIHEFIRKKFEPLVRAACGEGASLAHRVNYLIDKVWDANDRNALEPLIRAFQFPDDEALEIFSSWKGVIFYTYEYARTKEQRERFGVWLRDKARPRNLIRKLERDHLEWQRRIIVGLLRGNWNAVESIAREYETLYARFVSDMRGVDDFVKFLRRSHKVYRQVGNALSRINHAIFCWDVVSGVHADRLLSDDRLGYLFNILQRVLATK